MQLILNKAAYVWAQELIYSKRFKNEFFDWNKYTTDKQLQEKILTEDGLESFSMWFLALDISKKEDEVSRYQLPLGDHNFIYSSALKSIIDYSFNNDLGEIQNAAKNLLQKANMH